MLVEIATRVLHPVEMWLFGSRARSTARPDSDWDIVAVIGDDAPDAMTDPIVAWEIARRSEVPSTMLVTKSDDLRSIWGLPNTIGYDLARDGVRLDVGRQVDRQPSEIGSERLPGCQCALGARQP